MDGLIDSVRRQLYENWELCIADGSTDPAASEYIQRLARSDARIRYRKISNGGIAHNTNEALALSAGVFVAFLDHDDVLSRYALAEVVVALDSVPGADVVYSDEDKLSDDGRRRQAPFFKPDWSPELLLCVNYITHLVVVRASLIQRIAGVRDGYEGAQDYDLLLRATEAATSVVHVQKVLYHWRLADGSTAKGVGEKGYADDAGQRALADSLGRRGLSADVGAGAGPTSYRARFRPPVVTPSVSIVINCLDHAGSPQKVVDSVLQLSSYPNYEVIIVIGTAAAATCQAYLANLPHARSVTCLTGDWAAYSAASLAGRHAASGAFLVFIDGTMEILTPSWLDEMVGVAARPDIGAVGPLVYADDGTVFSAGLVLSQDGAVGHVFRGCKPQQWTVFGIPACRATTPR